MSPAALRPGAEIALLHRTGGVISAFVRDSARVYALTCAHLMNGALGSVAVSGGHAIGRLHHRVELADGLAVNEADCALVELDEGIAFHNSARCVDRVAEGDVVRIGGRFDAVATVRSVSAAVSIGWMRKPGSIATLSFRGVIVAGCEAPLAVGDSGTLVTRQGCAVGFVFASLPDDGFGREVGICDLGLALRELEKDQSRISGTLRLA